MRVFRDGECGEVGGKHVCKRQEREEGAKGWKGQRGGGRERRRERRGGRFRSA